MADQNITELPVKTSSGMTSSDYMLGIDSAEGYQMLIKDLGDYIIRNVQVNTIAGANQTLKAALDTLNSKTTLTTYSPLTGITFSKIGFVVALTIFGSITLDDGKTIYTISDAKYQPSLEVQSFTKVWNGSDYVDCTVAIQPSGAVTITDLHNGAIPSVDLRFLKHRPIVYIAKE